MKKFLGAVAFSLLVMGGAYADAQFAAKIDIVNANTKEVLDTAVSRTRFDTKEACEAFLASDRAKEATAQLKAAVEEQIPGATIGEPRCEVVE